MNDSCCTMVFLTKGRSRTLSSFSVIVLLCAVVCMAMPVTAVTGTVTITYRGSGGNYIGDTIVFDGKNTVGNSTLIKITGPGLPSEGVPLYDLDGTPGSGNTARVTADGAWAFRWDSDRADTAKLQTARYTFIASDAANPEMKAQTSILLKKPEFYIIATPSTISPGDYVEFRGMAEKDVTYVRIGISDASGSMIHTFISPVSGIGSFEYGFRTDMKPGQYNVLVTNPSMKNNLGLVLTVSAPQTPAAMGGAPPEGQMLPPVQTMISDQTQAPDTGSLPVSPAPSQTGITPLTLILSVIIPSVITILVHGSRKKF